MKDKKTKIWIIVMIGLCLMCTALFLMLKFADRGTVAVIRVDGEIYEKIDLSRVEEPYELEISTKFGHNTLLIEHNAISVVSADCPDKICVNQGRLTGGGIPIVCMPNRLVISMEGSDIDG